MQSNKIYDFKRKLMKYWLTFSTNPYLGGWEQIMSSLNVLWHDSSQFLDAENDISAVVPFNKLSQYL